MNTRSGRLLLLFSSLLSLCSCSSKAKTYEITYQDDDYVHFVGQTTIDAGATLVCAISYLSEEDYDYSGMKIYVNDEEIECSGRSFRVANVRNALVIREEGAMMKQYDITFRNTDSVTFSGAAKAERHSDYTFTVTKTDAENYDYEDLQILVNDVSLSPDTDGNYTVTDLTENLVIRSSGVLSNYVTIVFAQTSKFHFNGELTAKKHSTYTFTLTKLNSLISDSSIVVMANSVPVTGNDGTYTVDIDRDDLYIEVTKYDYEDPSAGDEENQGDNPVEDLD